MISLSRESVMGLAVLVLMARYVTSSELAYAGFVAWVERETGDEIPATMTQGMTFAMLAVEDWSQLQKVLKAGL